MCVCCECVYNVCVCVVCVGGEEQSKLVGSGVTSVDLEQLERGAQYEVQVMALVQDQEGSPVSVRVTTRTYLKCVCVCVCVRSLH